MIRYRVIPCVCSLPDGICQISYSLAAERLVGGSWIKAVVSPEISPDKDFVQHLAVLYTRLQLDPIHLLDALLDALP